MLSLSNHSKLTLNQILAILRGNNYANFILYFCEGSVFPDYLEVATAVVFLCGVGKTSHCVSTLKSVDMFFIVWSFVTIGF